MMKFNIFRAILFFLITMIVATVSWAQPGFDFPGGFSSGNPINEVYDITPDGHWVATLTGTESGPPGFAQVTIIDPLTGVRADSKMLPTIGRRAIKFVTLSDGIKVVAMADDNGNKHVVIYDMSAQGVLTFKSDTQLNNDPGMSISPSNFALSAVNRSGYVTLSSGSIQLISFSLDTGAILDTLTTPIPEHLVLFEDATRHLLVGGLNRGLVFVDVSHPSKLQELGRVTLPAINPTMGGTWQLTPVFSKDGNTVFAGNGYSILTAVDTNTRTIVGQLNSAGYRANQLKIYESGPTRMLVLKCLEDGSGVLKGFALINANDRTNLTIINEISFGEGIFRRLDFAIAQNGKRLFIGSEGLLTAYSIPALSEIWAVPLDGVHDPIKLITFGQRERILSAWMAFPRNLYSIPDFTNRRANFDQDGKSDLALYRPSNGTWNIKPGNGGIPVSVPFGQAGDVPVSADYDGDGISDLAVFRPPTGNWQIMQSSTGTLRTQMFGTLSDQFVPADYDGDGKDDIAVFRSGANRWMVVRSTDGQIATRKIASGRGKAVRGDYDGDGIADYAFFQSSGNWQIFTNGPMIAAQLGQKNDVPVSGDFDNDGKTDMAVFRPSTNTWIINQSFAGPRTVTFGQSGDLLVPADYDADGKTDLAVFRPSNNTWSILQSSNGGTVNTVFGQSGDIPIVLQK